MSILHNVRMSSDTQKEHVQRDHEQIVDACQCRAVDKEVSLLQQHTLKTKREVLAVTRPG